MSQIDHINLAISENKWYNKTIKYEKIEDQGPMRIAALLKITNKNELWKCLKEMKRMPKEVKEDIYDTTVKYSSIKSNLGLYDKELDDWKIREGDKSLARKEGYNSGYDSGYDSGIKKIAKKLLNENIPLDIILKTTNLTKKELDAIK